MSVHPSIHLLVRFSSSVEFISPLIFLYTYFCSFCCLFLINPFSLISVSFFHFCCPADSNVGTTSLQLASWQREVTETLREHSPPPPPGPRVCASVCPSSSSSSSCSPPTVAQMRLGCTDSADFLSDGINDFVFHLMQLAYNLVQNFLFHPIEFCVCFTSATNGSHSGHQ